MNVNKRSENQPILIRKIKHKFEVICVITYLKSVKYLESKWQANTTFTGLDGS